MVYNLVKKHVIHTMCLHQQQTTDCYVTAGTDTLTQDQIKKRERYIKCKAGAEHSANITRQTIHFGVTNTAKSSISPIWQKESLFQQNSRTLFTE